MLCRDNDDKYLSNDKSSGKIGDDNAPKMNVLGASVICVHTYLLSPQEYGKISGSIIIDDQETELAQDPGNVQF